jgi:hypothetical protein
VRQLLTVLAMLMSGFAWGQNCASWHGITFADGQVGCLTEHVMASRAPAGYSSSLRELLTANAPGHSVAVSRGPSCPLVSGISLVENTRTDPSLTPLRNRLALESCHQALSQARASESCTCVVAFSNHRSELRKPEFIALGTSGAPTPSQGGAVAADSDRARTDAMLAQLQKELRELQAARGQEPALRAQVPRHTARALVIGNGRYATFGALANPRNDAVAIAAKFRSFGIEVDLVEDASRNDIIHALNEHARKAAGKDVSILFYAGHGVQVEGVNYLIPVDMRADGISAGYVKLAGVSLNAVLDYMPAKTRLVFLDACRDNPAARSLMGTRAGTAPGLAPVDAASGTLVAYATRDGATAADGTGPNSPYTAALLRHIDQPLDISLVLRQVRQTVLQMTGGRQEPWEYGSLVGEQIVLPLMAR